MVSSVATGADSHAGTLIHKMSRSTVVARTVDWAYGPTPARALADDDPVKALAIADSHEHRVENTPPLR